jgi:putative salt-induced outer membrane protein
MSLRICGLLLALSVPMAAFAQSTAPPPAPPPPPPWTGEGSAGLVVTTGNSETTTANAKAQAIYASTDWRNTFDATVIKTEQTSKVTGLEEVTAERYLATNKSDFNLNERNYLFLALEFEKDLAGPIRQRTSETVGYGRKILTGPDHLLEAELGAGMRQTESQIIIPTAPVAVKDEDVIGRGRAAYKWTFRRDSHFGETLKVESGDTNTFVESVTEMRLSLIRKLYAQASYTARQNTKVPAGTEHTDTITAFSIGVTFGK